MMGIDEASFIETVDAYNAAYDAGEGVEFDVANESMLPVRTAPFYAMALRSVHLGTNVSVPVDENCRVLDADGNAVPNVFAGGEMMYGGNVVTTHMGAYSISNGFYSGRIAGEAARDEIIG